MTLHSTKSKQIPSLSSHFGEQDTQVQDEINHVFFYPTKNCQAIKVKEQLIVAITFFFFCFLVAIKFFYTA